MLDDLLKQLTQCADEAEPYMHHVSIMDLEVHYDIALRLCSKICMLCNSIILLIDDYIPQESHENSFTIQLQINCQNMLINLQEKISPITLATGHLDYYRNMLKAEEFHHYVSRLTRELEALKLEKTFSSLYFNVKHVVKSLQSNGEKILQQGTECHVGYL